MTKVLIDYNLSGQARLLLGTLQSLGWVELLEVVSLFRKLCLCEELDYEH